MLYANVLVGCVVMHCVSALLSYHPCSADENAMRTETNQLLSHINELKLRIVSHKIEHVANIIARLEMMAETSQATPADLLPREYEDWIEKDDVSSCSCP